MRCYCVYDLYLSKRTNVTGAYDRKRWKYILEYLSTYSIDFNLTEKKIALS
nr:hypothetical protein [Orientia tsutsugamushi]